MSWDSRSLETTWGLLYIIVLGMLRDKVSKLPEGSRPRPSLLKEQRPEVLSVVLKKKAGRQTGMEGLLREGSFSRAHRCCCPDS